MYYRDHTPPHFHAKYGDYRASLSIERLEILEGDLPSRVLSLVVEWAHEHRRALMEDWELAVEKKPLRKIQPLV